MKLLIPSMDILFFYQINLSYIIFQETKVI